MSLSASTCAADIRALYTGLISGGGTGDYPADFAQAYHDYASSGVVAGAVSGSGDPGLIEAAIRAAPTTPEELGQAFAAYWATVALTPASPNIAVINDALTYAAAFTAAVYSSVRDTESDPWFLEFITNLESVARMITWTITPPAPGSPFTSMIS